MLAIRLLILLPLILLLLAYLAFRIIKLLFSASRTARLKRKQNTLDKGEPLVLCLQCQSYVPRREAVFAHGNYFCREECAQLFMRTT